MSHLFVDLLPLLTAVYAVIEGLQSRLYVTIKDLVQVDVAAASPDDLVTDLYRQEPDKISTKPRYVLYISYSLSTKPLPMLYSLKLQSYHISPLTFHLSLHKA